MIRPCGTPGCVTLTFGEICLGCMQRMAKARLEADDRDQGSGDDSPSDSDTVSV